MVLGHGEWKILFVLLDWYWDIEMEDTFCFPGLVLGYREWKKLFVLLDVDNCTVAGFQVFRIHDLREAVSQRPKASHMLNEHPKPMIFVVIGNVAGLKICQLPNLRLISCTDCYLWQEVWWTMYCCIKDHMSVDGPHLRFNCSPGP